MQDFALDGMKFNSKFLGKVKVTLNVFFFCRESVYVLEIPECM